MNNGFITTLMMITLLSLALLPTLAAHEMALISIQSVH